MQATPGACRVPHHLLGNVGFLPHKGTNLKTLNSDFVFLDGQWSCVVKAQPFPNFSVHN